MSYTKKLAKELKVTVKPKYLSQVPMSPEELQNHLKMKKQGASTTKNGKAYTRKPKHKKSDY